MQKIIFLLSLFLCCLATSCSKSKEQYVVFVGEYTGGAAQSLRGANEVLPEVLREVKMSESSFYKLLKDPVETMTEAEKDSLYKVREKLVSYTRPLFGVYQKIIPLSEVQNYVSNRYRDVRGFVNYLGDAKLWLEPYVWTIYTPYGLFYDGSPFIDAAQTGVAVIRFQALYDPVIPYSEEFAGNKGLPYRYPEPYTGKGFSSMGIPEYFFDKNPILYDGEIYELTPSGRDILRATYTETGWKVHEGWVITKSDATIPAYNDVVKNGMYLKLDNRYFPAYMTSELGFVLVSNDPASAQYGFQLDIASLLYVRRIEMEDPLVDQVKAYSTYATIESDTFQLRGVSPDGLYHVVTSNPKLAQKYRMENCDYGTYRMMIPMENIDSSRIFVRKEEI